MKNRTLSLALLIAAGIARTSISVRSECATLPLDQQFERSSVVFVGRALSQSVITTVVPRETETTFEVERVWKGKPDRGKHLRVRTCGGVLGDEDLWCGEAFRFQPGSRYVVLAEGNPPKADVCDHTAPVADAEDTLRWLSTNREGRPPNPADISAPMSQLGTTVSLKAAPSSGDRARTPFDRIVKDSGDNWILQRAVRLTAVPGVRHEQEIYEWRDIADGNKRVFVSIHHYNDAAEAREYVDRLPLVVESAAIPVDGIGDAAKIGTMRPGDPSAPGTVHFSVDWMYVAVSAPTVTLATKLASDIAEELRTDASRR